jgi:alpha-ketoglutarate-dependent taurine dioxygenase
MSVIAVDLDVRPLSGTIGAEIRGIDLHRPLGPGAVAAVRRAWLRYKVVFFPGACLSPDEHLAFAQNFGQPTPAHPLMPGLDGFPEIFEIDYTAARRRTGAGPREYNLERGVAWHSDVTFAARPPMGSVLNAIEIPECGGDTLWSDQQAAFEGLSPVLQEFLGELTAVHDAGGAFAAASGERPAPVEHPVVRTHPETGAKVLFVNPTFTSHIKELAVDEGDALLAFLYARSVRPEYTVRYHWQPGDLGFWDNRCTQHAVAGDFGDRPRRIQRVTLEGDHPA